MRGRVEVVELPDGRRRVSFDGLEETVLSRVDARGLRHCAETDVYYREERMPYPLSDVYVSLREPVLSLLDCVSRENDTLVWCACLLHQPVPPPGLDDPADDERMRFAYAFHLMQEGIVHEAATLPEIVLHALPLAADLPSLLGPEGAEDLNGLAFQDAVARYALALPAGERERLWKALEESGVALTNLKLTVLSL